MKKLLVVAAFVMCCYASASAQNFSVPETRGVWITGNYLKGGADGIESVMRGLKAANFNVVYICTWYQGSTIYPSTVVPGAGGPAQNPDFTGTDPMRTTIDIAHKYGIEVIAWFEYGLSVGVGSGASSTPNILKLHPGWSMVQRDTTVRYDLDGGNYFFWVDPAVAEAADFMVALYRECAQLYPDIDGIELDRMRYPTAAYSYSDSSRARFVRETGNADPLRLTDDHAAWSVWRRTQVTNLVKRIYSAVKEVNASCIVTSAVVPPYMMYGGNQDKLQGWDVWAKNCYVDMLDPMLYLTTTDFPYQMNRCVTYAPAGFNLAAGIDINSAGSVMNAVGEINKARASGSTGQVIWYYGYLPSDALTSLKANVYQTGAAPAYDDLLLDDGGRGSFALNGSWSTQQSGFNGTSRIATAAAGVTAAYKVRILRDGQYNVYGYWPDVPAAVSRRAIIDVASKTVHVVDTVDQAYGSGVWTYLHKLRFGSGDTVTITVAGIDGAVLTADAFRIKRGSVFQLEDKAMTDSQSVLLRFSQPLVDPLPFATKITTSLGGTTAFSIDPTDAYVLHVTIPAVPNGASFTLTAANLLDRYFDTLTTTINFTYAPDNSAIVIDDQTANAFWKLAGVWNKETSATAENGSYYAAKPGAGAARVQWGPVKIPAAGYYDVYVNVPKTALKLSDKCMYILRDHNAVDTIIVSQKAAAGTLLKLGSFPFEAGDNFAPLLSSAVNTDTAAYVAADAVVAKRSVQITTVKKNAAGIGGFSVSQNFPNPFNPSTSLFFELNSRAFVSIDIYNVLGEKVASLADRKQYEPGKWSVNFDGASVSSGMYFAVARITSSSSEFKKTVKMVLVK